MKRIILCVFLWLPVIFGFSQETVNQLLPIGTNELIIKHQFYSLSYLTKFKHAEWVAYQITDSTAFGSYPRGNNFREDKRTNDISLKAFYAKSGYDRGHLCPAGSMAFDPMAMNESFFMSNMSPQVPGFNRGIWKKLESQVRTWGYENHHIYVVTGPVLTNFQDTIGLIPVPKYYYKVVLDYTEPEIKAIGLLLENKSSSEPLTSFVVSVDSVESLTGINFFSELPDSIENSLEQKSYPEFWSWKPIKVKTTKTATPTYRCISQTLSGAQCSRNVSDSNSYCWQHKPKSEPISMVWICGKSKKYHDSKSHAALGRCKSDIQEITLTEATSRKLKKCKCR